MTQMRFRLTALALICACGFATSSKNTLATETLTPQEPEQSSLTFYVVNYPPYMIVNGSNEISGMDVDVVTEAFKAVGLSVNFGVLPWKRVVKLMQVGKIAGGLSCSKRKGRETYMLFSDHISLTRQAAITRSNMDTSNIKTLSDLKNYRITTVSGWGTADQLNSHQINFEPSKDLRSGLVSVLHRGVDAFYGPEIPSMHSAKIMGEHDNIKAVYLDDIMANKLHLCIAAKYPDSDKILTTFNRGLKIIKENGLYEQIQAAYF
jgi:polar amino acid transport system substrate-binding protein